MWSASTWYGFFQPSARTAASAAARTLAGSEPMIGVLAVRLVPDRDDLDALLGGQHARPQLRLRLVGEPVADADGVFGKRKQDEASEGLDIDVVALRAGVRKPPMWLMRGV